MPPIRQLVTPLSTQDWDPRILICRYELAYEDYVLPMYVFIVITRHYVVLVDTLVNAATASALLDIARPHLSGRQLLVVNTHADYDHAWGNQYIAGPNSQAPAPIIGTLLCAQRMRSCDEHEQLKRLQQEQPKVYHDVELSPPTVLFEDTLTIDGGDLTLELFATPGHCIDHCSLYIPEIHTLLAGDAAEMPFPWVGDYGLADTRASLAKLAQRMPMHAFYCHAPVDAGPTLLQGNIDYFDELERSCASALCDGLDVDSLSEEELENAIAFPYEEALSGNAAAWADPRFYRPCHRNSIRAMLCSLRP